MKSYINMMIKTMGCIAVLLGATSIVSSILYFKNPSIKILLYFLWMPVLLGVYLIIAGTGILLHKYWRMVFPFRLRGPVVILLCIFTMIFIVTQFFVWIKLWPVFVLLIIAFVIVFMSIMVHLGKNPKLREEFNSYFK